MSIRRFAEARGIAPGTFYWWRSWLRRQPGDLVALDVVGDPEAAVPPVPTGQMYEIEVDSRLVLRVPSGFDADDVRRLVQVLRC